MPYFISDLLIVENLFITNFSKNRFYHSHYTLCIWYSFCMINKLDENINKSRNNQEYIFIISNITIKYETAYNGKKRQK